MWRTNNRKDFRHHVFSYGSHRTHLNFQKRHEGAGSSLGDTSYYGEVADFIIESLHIHLVLGEHGRNCSLSSEVRNIELPSLEELKRAWVRCPGAARKNRTVRVVEKMYPGIALNCPVKLSYSDIYRSVLYPFINLKRISVYNIEIDLRVFHVKKFYSIREPPRGHSIYRSYMDGVSHVALLRINYALE